MRTSSEINKKITAVSKRGLNVCLNEGWRQIRIVRAKSVNGRIFGRQLNGSWTFISPSADLVEV